MTCWIKYFVILLFLAIACHSGAPFVPLDTVHQAHSQFEVNLILNENRNHPILLVTVSHNRSREAAITVLQNVHKGQPLSAFSILIDCREFNWNLNHTLGICELYHHKSKEGTLVVEEDTDSHFSCQVFIPSEVKIKEKGHTLMKNHQQESINDGKLFNQEYLTEVVRKNIPDFVYYLEDQYELTEFLQENSDLKISKQPKLLYFDQNLLAPIFLRKLSALMDRKIQVAVTDDPPISKKYETSFDSLILLEYSFEKKKYEHRPIPFDEYQSPETSIIKDQTISKYLKVKKNRDILLDFEYNNSTIYKFATVSEIQYLQTHGRPIIVEVSKTENNFTCEKVHKIVEKEQTLFNYVCYAKASAKDIDPSGNKFEKELYMIINSVSNGTWFNQESNVLNLLPKSPSRQKVSTETEALQCIKTAEATSRDAIFFYFNQKTHANSIAIFNYLNYLPEVTSLQFFCQVYLPNEDLVKKFSMKQNSLFRLFNPDEKGHMRMLEQSNIQSFIEIKMFLRQIAIKNMLKVYQDRLINNKIEKIDSSEHLTDKCFDRKCIIALIATGRYREEQEMKMLKELKLQYEELFRFVWIDGICHWDVPRQLKILKKKEKVIDRSYIFFYNEKDMAYNLWESKKFWDKKELEKWIKSLRNNRKINHLKFALDIEDRICKKVGQAAPLLPDQL